MSQKKVDAYKEAKKNRKEEVAKDRAKKKLNKGIGIAVIVVVIAAPAVGIFFTIKNSAGESNSGFGVDTIRLKDYSDLEGLGTETEEGETEETGETEDPEKSEAEESGETEETKESE